MNKLEKEFQRKLKKKLETLFPGCIVLKNNANEIQGIPDLLILYKKHWAALECKRSAKAHRQPNQLYFCEKLNNMSFCRFIYPENEKEVLDEIQQAFRV